MSRAGTFLSHVHPKVIVTTLASALVAAFAPMVPSLVKNGTVTVSRGQLGLAALVGFLTFLSGWLKNGHYGPVAQEIVTAALDAVAAMHPGEEPPLAWSAPIQGTSGVGASTWQLVTVGGPPTPPAPAAANSAPLDSPPGTGSAAVLPPEPPVPTEAKP